MYIFTKITDKEINLIEARKECIKVLKSWLDEYKRPHKIDVDLLYKSDKDRFEVSAKSVLGINLEDLKEKTQKSLEKFYGDYAYVDIIGNYGYKQNEKIKELSLTKFKIEPSDEFTLFMKEYLEDKTNKVEELEKYSAKDLIDLDLENEDKGEDEDEDEEDE